MKKAGELHLLETLEEPWQEINIDTIRLLPRSNRKYAIVVIVDQFIKIIQLKATIMNISLEEVTKVYQDEVWKLYGVLQKVLSDRGPQFASRFIKRLNKGIRDKKNIIYSILSSDR